MKRIPNQVAGQVPPPDDTERKRELFARLKERLIIALGATTVLFVIYQYGRYSL